MKRAIGGFLLATLLLLTSAALAEGTEAASFFVTDPNGETEDFIIATAALDGRLYMLSHQRLYEYAPDQPDAEILLDWGGIMASLNHGQSREAWLEDFARTRVNALIQGEDAVYGVNHRYGTLFRLDGGDLSPWGAVDPALAGLEDSFGPMFTAGEHLYYAAHTDDEDADVLVDYDLARQSRVCHEAGRVHDIALAEGQVALLRESRATEGALEIALLALRTGQVSVAAVFPDRDVSGLCAWEGRILYLQDNQVHALQASGGDSRMGFIPWHAGSLQYGLLMLTPDTAALTSPQGIWVRPLTERPQEERTLRLCLKDTAYVPSFQASCPDVTLSLTDASGLSGEELIRGLLDGTLAQDVIEVDAAMLFPAMADKGYLAELSASSVLAAEHARLYPALQQAVCRNGQLYGVPASLRVRCWAYQPERWQRALPDVPPPQTLEAWTALCRAWLREGPMMYPPDVLLEGLCADMLHLYIAQFDQPGEDFSFDTEAFRRMLTELDSVKAAYRAATPAAPGEDAPLLISSYDAFFRRDAYGLAEDWTPLLPVTVGERPAAVDAKMTVYVVNAASGNIPDALRFLEFVAEHRTYADERLMQPGANTPVQRPGFAAEEAALRDNLAWLRTQLERCDEASRRELESTIQAQEALLAGSEERRWLISPGEIAGYRIIAQRMQVRQTALARVEGTALPLFHGILCRYLADGMDAEACIRMLEERLFMMLSE
ncbi:MAG: hypothetical protein ACI4OY_02195 [Aristaeellaceae bacterium]